MNKKIVKIQIKGESKSTQRHVCQLTSIQNAIKKHKSTTKTLITIANGFRFAVEKPTVTLL